MKLLYKHDNEVIDVIFEDCDGNLRVINKNDTSKEGEYGSIKSFLKDFEDVPAEPLIKDEKVRKAVRAWAEANKIKPRDTIHFDALEHRLTWVNTAIEFNGSEALLDLEELDYTIAELCGDEE